VIALDISTRGPPLRRHAAGGQLPAGQRPPARPLAAGAARPLARPLVTAVINMSVFQIGMTYGVPAQPGRTALLIYTMPI
jgi:hypothetical protein